MERAKTAMVEGNYASATAEAEEQIRAECKRNGDKLLELTRIHLSIDEPSRSIGADEPDWIGRLRKICLHARAIGGWEVGNIDIAHLMAPELRAAYVQMDVVWKRIPPEFKRKHGLDIVDSEYWANEARSGMLATYDHPTPLALALLRARHDNLHSGTAWRSYTQLAIWLLYLGLGYGSALVYLAEDLGVGEDVATRLAEVLMQGIDKPAAMERISSFPGHGERLGDS